MHPAALSHHLRPPSPPHQILVHNGDTVRGRQGIIGKLKAVAQMHAGFKVVHHVKDVDCQPLGIDGSALVHVQGFLQIPGVSGPASQPTPFTESFILGQIQPGEYYVANQAHRTLF